MCECVSMCDFVQVSGSAGPCVSVCRVCLCVCVCARVCVKGWTDRRDAARPYVFESANVTEAPALRPKEGGDAEWGSQGRKGRGSS